MEKSNKSLKNKQKIKKNKDIIFLELRLRSCIINEEYEKAAKLHEWINDLYDSITKKED